MNIKRPLAPGFLKRFDRYLLLNKPVVWSIRTHMVLYYGILFMVVLGLISYIVPDDPREDSVSDLWVGFVSIISLVALVTWIIYLLRFNVFKRYGLLKPADSLLSFILYFITTAIIVLFPAVQPYVESYRANKAYGNEEIMEDVNNINRKIAQLEYDSLNHTWNWDTLKVTSEETSALSRMPDNSYYQEALPIDTMMALTSQNDLKRITSFIISRSALKEKLAAADSVVQLHDSLFLIYHAPRYVFLSTFNGDTYSRIKELKSIDIYRQVIKNYIPPPREKLRNELNTLVRKYEFKDYTPARYMTEYEDRPGRIEIKYHLDDVRQAIQHIIERKYRWSPHRLSGFFRLIFYITLTLSLLIFIFRHSTAKTFFLSVLTAIILILLSALFMAFGGYKNNAFWGCILFYYLMSFMASLFTWKTHIRRAVTGIGINLFTFLTAIIPVTGLALYNSILEERWIQNNNEAYLKDGNLYFLAEITGWLLLLILIVSYIQAVYRKWYSLPEA